MASAELGEEWLQHLSVKLIRGRGTDHSQTDFLKSDRHFQNREKLSQTTSD